jgi:hypothetical protein
MYFIFITGMTDVKIPQVKCKKNKNFLLLEPLMGPLMGGQDGGRGLLGLG